MGKQTEAAVGNKRQQQGEPKQGSRKSLRLADSLLQPSIKSYGAAATNLHAKPTAMEAVQKHAVSGKAKQTTHSVRASGALNPVPLGHVTEAAAAAAAVRLQPAAHVQQHSKVKVFQSRRRSAQMCGLKQHGGVGDAPASSCAAVVSATAACHETGGQQGSNLSAPAVLGAGGGAPHAGDNRAGDACKGPKASLHCDPASQNVFLSPTGKPSEPLAQGQIGHKPQQAGGAQHARSQQQARQAQAAGRACAGLGPSTGQAVAAQLLTCLSEGSEDAAFMAESFPVEEHARMMLCRPKWDAYFRALRSAAPGKVVMDVGSGCGVLALMAAQCGAARVYAIELCPDIAALACQVVQENERKGTIPTGVVQVIVGDVRSITIPHEQVDVLVSDWIGHLLWFENIWPVVRYARDRFLRTDGLLLPSKASMLAAGVCAGGPWKDQLALLESSYRGLSFNALRQPVFAELHPYSDLSRTCLATQERPIATFDLTTVGDSASTWSGTIDLPLRNQAGTSAAGLAISFTLGFPDGTELSAGIDAMTGPTHWGHCVLFFDQRVPLAAGQSLQGFIQSEQQRAGSAIVHVQIGQQRLERVLQWVSAAANDVRWQQSNGDGAPAAVGSDKEPHNSVPH